MIAASAPTPTFIIALAVGSAGGQPVLTVASDASLVLGHATAFLTVPALRAGRLWQDRGRNESTFGERLRLLVESIESMSPLLDLKVMLWTVGSVVKRSGA